MNRNALWFSMAVGALIMGWAFYSALGGFAGMARDPQTALIVLAISIPIFALTYWRAFRRLKKRPLDAPISTPKFRIPTGESLDNPPVVLTAVRWKIAAVFAVFLGFGAILLLMQSTQTGLCRIGMGLITLPFVALSSLTWLACLWAPPVLTLAPEGLRYKTLVTDKRWRWDEVGEVTVSRSRIPVVGALFVRFQRLSRPSEAPSTPYGAIRSIWKPSGEDVGALLAAARLKWASAAGDLLVPAPWTWLYWMRLIASMAVMLFVVWILVQQPCGAPR